MGEFYKIAEAHGAVLHFHSFGVKERVHFFQRRFRSGVSHPLEHVLLEKRRFAELELRSDDQRHQAVFHAWFLLLQTEICFTLLTDYHISGFLARSVLSDRRRKNCTAVLPSFSLI